jgi:hypothetical protein
MRINTFFQALTGRLLASALLLLVSACQVDDAGNASNTGLPEAPSAKALHHAQLQLTASIVDDVFSPPVAARIYAYASLASYEALSHASQGEATAGSLPSLAGVLNGYAAADAPKEDVDPGTAALEAFYSVARALVFTEALLHHEQNAWRASLSGDTAASLQWGRSIAAHVLGYAANDLYDQTRTMPKHPAPDGEDQWVPTPPLFMAGIEPHWNKIRPFTLDSAAQFRPEGPSPYSLSEGSAFRNELLEVYQTAVDLSEEQEAIARFWDCNPYVTQEQAHLMPGIKKITPGGHWMGIARMACQTTEADFARSAEAYAWTAMALHDGFISCWDEKYRSNLIRPETLINRHLDPDWKPLLETPPFPEHTSGHSVISAAAAETLGALFGTDLAYVDSVEVAYGLPPRAYEGFRQASEEAAISRLYGGIHYMPAIDLGVAQGRLVGAHVLTHLPEGRALVPALDPASASQTASLE